MYVCPIHIFMRTHNLIAGLLICLLANSCERTIEGSGPVRRSELALDQFNEITVKGSLRIVLEYGEPRLIIETNENLHQYIKYAIEKERLTLHTGRYNLRAEKLDITVRFNELEEIDISGWCDLISKGTVKSNNLTLKITGGGHSQLKIESDEFNLNVSGAATSDIKGKARSGDIDISGAARINASDLLLQEAIVSVSGAADLSLNVEQALDLDISGAAHVDYRGNPSVDQNVSGGAQVNQVR